MFLGTSLVMAALLCLSSAKNLDAEFAGDGKKVVKESMLQIVYTLLCTYTIIGYSFHR